MNMYEIKVFGKNGQMIRKSLIQAQTYDKARPEAMNVFSHTVGANSYTIEY